MNDLFYINEDIQCYKKVVIYGTGWAGRNMLLKLLQHNVKVDCFTDSDPEKCGSLFMNIPIVHIDELQNERETAAVIVSGRYALIVAAELEKRGFIHLFFDYGNDVNIIHLEREVL